MGAWGLNMWTTGRQQMGFIYKIINSITGKCYIGETMRDPNKRFSTHMKLIKGGRGCPALRDAVKKHGEENFIFEILLECPDGERFEKEKEYIKTYNSMVPNGYNILEGGQGCSGFKHSDETKARLSEISKKRFQDSEMLKKKSEGAKQYWKDPENRKAHSNRIKNSENHKKGVKQRCNDYKEHKEESKIKISNSLKEYHKNKENPEKSEETRKKIGKAQEKPVIQYDREDKIIRKFKSTKEASEVLDISAAGISHVLHGRAKTSGGFVWKFDIEMT